MSVTMPATALRRRPRLGQLLVERGWITGEQLLRAVQTQRVVGGRIGTCLLEMGVLSEDGLLTVLAEQLGVPSIRLDRLPAIEDQILSLVPRAVARRCQAIPLRSSEHDVTFATLDVDNLAHQDELAFCANRRVRFEIANEVRVHQALERFYGIECPRRYGHLLARLDRERYQWDEAAQRLFPSSDEAPVWSERKPGNGHGTVRRDGAPEASREEPDLRLTLTDVDLLLRGEPDRELVAQTALRFLSFRFERAAVFAVRGARVEGWLCHGADRAGFAAWSAALDGPSFLLTLRHGAELHRGPLAPTPIHRDLAAAWGLSSLPRRATAIPVRFGDRLVAVLYGDRDAGPADEVDVTELQALAGRISTALARCILRRKGRSTRLPATSAHN